MKKSFAFALLLAGTVTAFAQRNNSGYPPPGCYSKTTTTIGGSARGNVSPIGGGGAVNGGYTRTNEKYCAPTPPPQRQQPQPRPMPQPVPNRPQRRS